MGAPGEPRLRDQQQREGDGQERRERRAAGGGEKQVVEDGGPRAQVKPEAGLLACARRESVGQVEAQRVAEREPLEERERQQACRDPGAEDPARAQPLARRREEDERAEHGREEQQRVAQARGEGDREPREPEQPLRAAHQELERERHRAHAQARRDGVLPEDDGIEPERGREAGDEDRERAAPRRELGELRDPSHACEQRERGEQRQQAEAGVAEQRGTGARRARGRPARRRSRAGPSRTTEKTFGSGLNASSGSRSRPGHGSEKSRKPLASSASTWIRLLPLSTIQSPPGGSIASVAAYTSATAAIGPEDRSLRNGLASSVLRGAAACYPAEAGRSRGGPARGLRSETPAWTPSSWRRRAPPSPRMRRP